MEIATVGWGNNNWSAFGHNTDNRTPGSLFVGQFANKESEVLGKSFASRPDSVKFYYKYYSYNNEYTVPFVEVYNVNGEVIGRGEISINSSTGNDYVLGRMVVNYMKNEKASSIAISFKSTTVDNPATKDIQGSKTTNGGYGDSRHIGSILTIDDVSLIYE